MATGFTLGGHTAERFELILLDAETGLSDGFWCDIGQYIGGKKSILFSGFEAGDTAQIRADGSVLQPISSEHGILIQEVTAPFTEISDNARLLLAESELTYRWIKCRRTALGIVPGAITVIARGGK